MDVSISELDPRHTTWTLLDAARSPLIGTSKDQAVDRTPLDITAHIPLASSVKAHFPYKKTKDIACSRPTISPKSTANPTQTVSQTYDFVCKLAWKWIIGPLKPLFTELMIKILLLNKCEMNVFAFLTYNKYFFSVKRCKRKTSEPLWLKWKVFWY